MYKSRRIVITGSGIVSPLGCGTQHVWHSLLAGKSGISQIKQDWVKDIAVKIAGLVPSIEDMPYGFDSLKYLSAKEDKKIDRFIKFAIHAAYEAMEMANLIGFEKLNRERFATIIATGIGGFPAITNSVRLAQTRGANKLSPFTIPSFLANLAAGQISILFGLKGPIGTPVTACAAGVQAIGDAVRLIKNNEADIALCGGTEACINEVSLGGFTAARALSTNYNHSPEQASRPFDQNRDGFVMGEGAGLLVIEELEHALSRGATPLAEIVGYGTSADAYHITAGPANGEGAARAMRLAIAQSAIEPNQIGHLNAHSTSTILGDKAELAAIKSVFNQPSNTVISATKAATGHLLGAAGGIEAIFAFMALREQIAPPTINLQSLDEDGEGLEFAFGKPKPIKTEFALTNGFGFGGVNASLVLKYYRI